MEKGYKKTDLKKMLKVVKAEGAEIEYVNETDETIAAKVSLTKDNQRKCYVVGTSVSSHTGHNYYFLNIYGSSFGGFPWYCHGGDFYGDGSYMYSHDEMNEIVKGWVK